MSIVWSEDQEELRTVVRHFCETRSSEAQVRTVMQPELGFDPDVWAQMGGQLGLPGLAIPEAYGGAGFSQLEVTLVAEEFGRSLMCSPFLGTVGFAAPLLEATGDEDACRRWLPSIAAGELIVAVAAPGDRDLSPGVDVSRSGGAPLLSGSVPFVLDGAAAELLLVVARDGDDLALFAVDPAASGVTRTPQPTVDQTRRFARVNLADVPATPIATVRPLRAVLDEARDRAVVTLAAEQVGGAERMLDMSVQYAILREQFGRPIGSFQAIKHRCADMLLQVEGARSAAYHAAMCVASGSPEVPLAAAVAGAAATEAFLAVTADAIQIHGGVGFTWEHPAHLYFKRALSSEHLFGDAATHREALMRVLEASEVRS